MTKYITPSDYLNYFGENLDLVLPDDDMSDSRKAERFLTTVEDDVSLFLATKCFKRIDEEFGKMTDYQKDCYKKALLNQARYKIKNGDIANDSGYDPTSGIVASQNDLKSLQLSSKTLDYLRLAGLYNRNIIASGGGWFNRFF